MERQKVRSRLERWYGAAVAAVEPVSAMGLALSGERRPAAPPAILAIGKAAEGMAVGAVRWLGAHGMDPVGGIVISHSPAQTHRHGLDTVTGDHPLPGARSLAASQALADAIDRIPPGTPVMVLLSGGASSLIGAPLEGITPEELRRSFLIFHELGFEIGAMNALRKRLTRWGGGQLGAALQHHEVTAWVISDVIGNDLSTIGSGPLVPDTVHADHLIQALTQPGLLSRLPVSAVVALKSPPPGPTRSIPHRIVADAATAAEGARKVIAGSGHDVKIHWPQLTDTVDKAAREIAVTIEDHWRSRWLNDPRRDILAYPSPRKPVYMIWTGEPTLKLPRDHGVGGRAQQLALMLARELARMDDDDPATVLVAGTDGRDGPTDAAGAVVDAETARDLAARGIDIDSAIARADAHPALDAAGALLRTGATGTNVADIMIVQGWSWY